MRISLLISSVLAPTLPASGDPAFRTLHDKGRAPTFSFSRLLPFLILLLLTAPVAQGQDVATYQMTASSGTFTPITGGTTVNTLAQPDAISPIIALPFTFYYGGTAFTTLQATTRGYLDLTGSLNAYSLNGLGWGKNYIAPLWDQLSGIGGTASYVVTGTTPNRVFTFQWLNWRWGTTTAANISFQAKLYEGSNLIQFVYRPEAGVFVSSTASATIGMEGGTYYSGDNNSYKNYVSLSNASASAVLVSNLNPAGFSMNDINALPVAGQTYTFTPLNDYCGNAIPLTYGGTVTGSTLDASMVNDPRATCSVGGTGTPTASPGVFYSLPGNGQTIIVSTCSGPTATGGNTKLFVYAGTCGNLTCVGNNDDVGASGCGTNAQASSVTFATQTGTSYLIFVQYALPGSTGPFGLRVSATGLATTAAFGAGQLDVYPNPATRQFTLRLPALAGERTAQVTLLNSLGQHVRTQAVAVKEANSETSFDVQGLPHGLYTVRVQAGAHSAARQVVVE